MNDHPQTAGSAESDLIESMLLRQDQVLSDLDNLFDRIDAVIADLTEHRKREAADAEAGNFLPFGPQPVQEQARPQLDQLGQSEKAA